MQERTLSTWSNNELFAHLKYIRPQKSAIAAYCIAKGHSFNKNNVKI